MNSDLIEGTDYIILKKFTKNKFKCLKCNKGFVQLKYLRQHKCENTTNKSINKLYICNICKKNIYQSHKKEHNNNCIKNYVKEEYSNMFNFFKYIYKILIRLNLNTIKRSIVNNNEEKRNLIFKYKLLYFHNQDQYNKKNNFLKKKIEKERKKMKKRNYILENKMFLNKIIRCEFHDNSMNTKIEIRNNLKEYIMNHNIPLISLRELIIKYFNNKFNDNENINNYIIEYINEKYNKKDYYTDNEIKNIDENLYEELIKTRKTSTIYKENLEKIDKEFKIYFKEITVLKCDFCYKFVKNKINHFKKCKEFIKNYITKKNGTIEYVIINVLEKYFRYSSLNIDYFQNYYNDLDYNYFLKYIIMHLKKGLLFDEYLFKQEVVKNKNNNIQYNNEYIFNILKDIEKKKEGTLEELKVEINYRKYLKNKKELNEIYNEIDNNEIKENENDDNKPGYFTKINLIVGLCRIIYRHETVRYAFLEIKNYTKPEYITKINERFALYFKKNIVDKHKKIISNKNKINKFIV